MEEDFPLGERMQIGFESGATEEVIYGRNEPSLVHFHRSIRKCARSAGMIVVLSVAKDLTPAPQDPVEAL